MKITSDSFGILVRPRNLSYANLMEKDQTCYQIEKLKIWWNINASHRMFRYAQVGNLARGLKKNSIEEVFKEFEIGNTNNEDSNYYYAKIVGMIGYFGKGIFRYINSKEQYLELEQQFQRQYGEEFRRSISILSVEVVFCKGNQGKEKEWNGYDSSQHWFYDTDDLLELSKIQRFESLKPGNVIKFKNNTNHVVVEVKPLARKRFYEISSWTNSSIKLLNNKGNSIKRLDPERDFEVVITSTF